MNKVVKGALIGAAVITAGVTVLSIEAGTRIRSGTTIGPVSVSGLTPGQAEAKLTQWWRSAQNKPFALSSPRLQKSRTETPAELGISFDGAASLRRAPRSTLLDLVRKPKRAKIAPVLRLKPENLQPLTDEIAGEASDPARAKVFYANGQFVRIPETGEPQVDEPKLQARILKAVAFRTNVDVPFAQGSKRVSDHDLAGINEVVTEFTTHFSTGKKSRCNNIHLASSRLNGLVLLPGDRMSFNDTVGRRTVKGGFQVAGVYKNGKHDVDVGGGICQVSTTLYNAALLADLKILQRHNHSMPVPYVPLGQDATVDYGALDLEIENNTAGPIAICSEYHPGKLTFRVLGKKDPGLTVKIESAGKQRWNPGTQLVSDPTLAPGQKKVLDKGASGESVKTYRVVYRDGKEVRRESLGMSYYKGGQKVIAVGSAPVVARTDPTPLKLVSADSH